MSFLEEPPVELLSYAERYNAVPGRPNCHYDTVGKTHVWHAVDAAGKWIGPGIGYSKLSCSDARCACMRAGNCGQLKDCGPRAPKFTPSKVVNPVSGRKNITPNCFLKDNETTICWESPPGSNNLSCSKGKELANFFGVPVIYDRIPANSASCMAIRGKWCKEKTSNNCAAGGGGAAAGGGAGGGAAGGDVDADCNSWGAAKGLCVFGKSILKGMQGAGAAAGEWGGSPIAQFMPVIMVGGGIVLIAILLKGK